MERRWWKACTALVAAVALAGLASTSFALDAKRINDIRRASDSQKLLDLADKFIKDDSSRQPKDFEEGTQIATEMAVYLLYIQIKQNEMVLQKLQEQLDR
ncbi:MAG: hypothetical protein IH608_02140 [Proteobacteria bacterium]|nr:hypothetical protein [Pseudomonadota bacterium]